MTTQDLPRVKLGNHWIALMTEAANLASCDVVGQESAYPDKEMRLLQKQIRTVVVDDSAIALETICTVAGREQNLLVVGAATNGNAALEMVRTLHPDLVLLDVEMPIMSGIEATSCIVRESPETRVVIVTAHDSPELRRVCRERGAHGFIAKTALKDELPVVVRRLFGNGNL